MLLMLWIIRGAVFIFVLLSGAVALASLADILNLKNNRDIPMNLYGLVTSVISFLLALLLLSQLMQW